MVYEASQWTTSDSTSASSGSAGESVDSLGEEHLPQMMTTKGAVVLIADDNHDMRTYVSNCLSKHYRCIEAANGEAALSMALKQRPDLVLSDMMMPRLDGAGLLRALREDSRTQLIPVILLSARAGEEARVEGLMSGADDYLVKVQSLF